MKQSTRRLLAYGSNATLVTLMVVVVVGLLYALAEQFHVQWDLSADAANTLEPDTLAKLRLLDQDAKPVTITAFTAQNGKPDAYFKNRAMKDLLEEIGDHSQVVTWRQVDFDRERLTAEKLGVREYGHVVVERGDDRVDIKDRELFRRVGKGKDRKLVFVGESALSRAFSQLMSKERRVVYVVSGHGELDPEDNGPGGMSDLVSSLDEERFDVKKLDILSTDREGAAPKVPDDAAVVFLARPKTAIAPQESDVLLDYLGRGGSLLVAVDVGYPPPDVLHRMGVSVPDGVAMDKYLVFPYRDRPVPRFRSHPITRSLIEDQVTTVLAQPAPLATADPPPDGVRYSPLLVTSRRGWIERGGPLDAGSAVYQPEIDGPGPVTMALAILLQPGKGVVRRTAPIGRVVVVGDAEAFTNALFAEGPGNDAFAVNVVHWLAGDDQRLAVSVGRATKVRRLAITKVEETMLRWVSMGFMPLVVLGFGVATWTTRRGR